MFGSLRGGQVIPARRAGLSRKAGNLLEGWVRQDVQRKSRAQETSV